MPDQPYYLESITRWAAWHLDRNTSESKLETLFEKRYPGLPLSDLRQAIDLAKELIDIRNGWEMLAPNVSLRNLLGAIEPPADSTYINFTVSLVPTGPGSQNARTIYKEVQWRGSWDTPKEIITEFIDAMVKALIELQYPQFGGSYQAGELVLDSLIWFQHPEQR